MFSLSLLTLSPDAAAHSTLRSWWHTHWLSYWEYRTTLTVPHYITKPSFNLFSIFFSSNLSNVMKTPLLSSLLSRNKIEPRYSHKLTPCARCRQRTTSNDNEQLYTWNSIFNKGYKYKRGRKLSWIRNGMGMGFTREEKPGVIRRHGRPREG